MEFYNAGINHMSHNVPLLTGFQMPMPAPEKIKNLVFSGGGTKGIAYVGVLGVLDDLGITKNIERYAGASAGAITAALLAIGMTTKEIEANLPTSFMKFLDPEKGKADDIVKELGRIGKAIDGSIDFWDIIKLITDSKSIIKPEMEHMGLFKGDAFLSWLKGCFNKKEGINGEITFKELHDKTKKELHLMLCNANYGKTIVANHINTPDMPVALAVRCSMAIPFFFYPIKYKGDVFVDGGTMYNYPIEIFDNVCEPDETLGFILSTASSILWPERSEDNGFFQHLGRVFGAIMNVSYEYCFREGNASRTIFVDPAGVSSINFNLSEQQINNLKANGKNAAEKFFSSRFGPDQNLPIQREYSYPIVVPSGKTISASFCFKSISEVEECILVNGNLFNDGTDILFKATTCAAWSWTNTQKTNAIIFVTGWNKADKWLQIPGIINSHNSIDFGNGLIVSYDLK